MKTSKFICGAVALMLLFNVSVGTSVDVFAANANDTVTNDNTQVLLKKSDINAAEKYIIVENNQYKLSRLGSSRLSSTREKRVEAALANANAAVANSNYLINPKTKEGVSFFSNRSTPSKSTNLFWYGVRNIYRSNAAINKDIRRLKALSANTGKVAGVTGVAGAASLMFPAVPVGVGFLSAMNTAQSWVYGHWYNTLSHAQKKYKVYWTVYWSLNSKAGAWHGK